jgi:UDP-galactopyranose mutase
MVEGVTLRLGEPAKVANLDVGPVRVFCGGEALDADVVISTMPIDELVGRPDSLPYVGRDFHFLMLPCDEVFPGNVRFCHYAGRDDEWTRVTEFKKLTGFKSSSTLLVLEKPSANGKLYIFQTKSVQAKVKEYLAMLPKNVYSIGRLGTGRYSTIEQAIAMAFACAAKITGKANEMEGQDFAIGDKSLLPKDRKVVQA